MELSLGKLPWYGQVGAFVVVSALAIFGFWNFYVKDIQTDIDGRKARLAVLRGDIQKGTATARRLPEFQAQVTDLQHRLDNLRSVLPEEKDVADILRRVQGLATQSNLSLQKFTPQPAKQQAMYAELPYQLVAEGTYHNFGVFLDKISKFHRIINVSEIAIKAKQKPEPNATITAECIATTFVLQESKPAAKPGAKPATPAAGAAPPK
jgi:type IV pilus assembly protein PilO